MQDPRIDPGKQQDEETLSGEQWAKAVQSIDQRDWDAARKSLKAIISTRGGQRVPEAEALLTELDQALSKEAAVDFLASLPTDDLSRIENNSKAVPARFSRETLQRAWSELVRSVAGGVLGDRRRREREQAVVEERDRALEMDRERTAAREQFLQVILGPTQEGYAEHGFKGVELGTRFAQLANQKSLKPLSPFETAKFQSSAAPGDFFYFDRNDRLIALTKSYDGHVDDYIPQLVELFGKSMQEADEVSSEAVTKAIINYRFEKTWVRIVASSMVPDRNGNNRRSGRVFLIVVDEDWLGAHMLECLERRRQQVLWAKNLLDTVESSWAPTEFPQTASLEIERQTSRPGAAVFHFFDQRIPPVRRRSPSSVLEAAAGLRLNVESIDGATVPPADASIELLLHFPRHPNSKPGLKGQQDLFSLPANMPEAQSSNYDPLAVMGLSDLLLQANLTLFLPEFRPRDIDSVTRSVDRGAFHYRWKSEDGWSLHCSGNDTVLIARPRRRRL